MRRTLVLLPGLDGSEVMFRPLVRLAPADVDPVLVGYPRGSANDYPSLLPCVLHALPRDRPFYLLGWSFSGPLALMAAAANPPHLRGVILVSSFVRRPMAYVPRWVRHLARPVVFRAFPLLSRAKARLIGYGTREVSVLLDEALSNAGPEALACRARAALAVDAGHALSACPVPVLYIRARADEVIRRSAGADVLSGAATAAVVEIEGSHLALVTNPSASWSALQAFMDRIEDSGVSSRSPASDGAGGGRT